jgi:uncharacterized membrane protein
MSMTKVSASVQVDAPLADVWAYASDWRHWEDWWVGVAAFKPTTVLERGNGTRYSYRAWIAGIWLTLETEISDFVEEAGWRGSVTKGPPHRTQWVFERAGGGTRLTYILEYRLPVPLLGGVFDALLMRPGWRHRLEASLQNLKRHFEQAPERLAVG